MNEIKQSDVFKMNFEELKRFCEYANIDDPLFFGEINFDEISRIEREMRKALLEYVTPREEK